MPVSSTNNGKDTSRMNGEDESSNSEGDSSSSCKRIVGVVRTFLSFFVLFCVFTSR